MASIPSAAQSSERKVVPFITLALIAANLIVFIFVQGSGSNPNPGNHYSTIPREIITGYDLTVDTDGVLRDSTGNILKDQDPVHVIGPIDEHLVPQYSNRTVHPFTTLFTYMFLHLSWAHIGFNMLFLFVFGSVVEAVIGHWKYLSFYIASGLLCGFLVALIVWILWGLKSPAAVLPSIGASGAIAGIMGSYVALLPARRILGISESMVQGTMVFGFPIIEFPGWAGWIFAGMWLINEVVGSLRYGFFAGANHLAHILGFSVGVTLVFMNASAVIIAILYIFPVIWPALRDVLASRLGM